MRCFRLSPLDTLETTFRLLASGPQPLALDCQTVGLQGTSIGLLDLRAVVFHPATSVPIQRAVLAELVRRARQHRGQWIVGLAGVLLAGLLRSPAGPTSACSGTVIDFGVTMLAGLLELLDATAVPSEEVAERLLWTVLLSPAQPVVHARGGTRLVSSDLPGDPVSDEEKMAETLRSCGTRAHVRPPAAR
jgi:hypothetical protein